MNREKLQNVVNLIEKLLESEGIPKGSVSIKFKEENQLSEAENLQKAEAEIGEINGDMGIMRCWACCSNGTCGICCDF